MTKTRDPYLEALQSFTQVCETKFRDDVLSVIVMGSVARDEHVVGKSDIEMVCVLKKEITAVQRIAAISESFTEIMKRNGIPHPYLEVLRPSEYEKAYLYLDLFSTYDLKVNGKVVYGDDIRSRMVFPSGERLKQWAEIHILSMRRSAYKTALSCGPNLERVPDEVIEALATHVAFAAGTVLIGRGVMVSLKREIMSNFTKTFPTLQEFDYIMKRANENPPTTLEQKRSMVMSCLAFLDKLCTRLINRSI